LLLLLCTLHLLLELLLLVALVSHEQGLERGAVFVRTAAVPVPAVVAAQPKAILEAAGAVLVGNRLL
jgi:hypothetical protein